MFVKIKAFLGEKYCFNMNHSKFKFFKIVILCTLLVLVKITVQDKGTQITDWCWHSCSLTNQNFWYIRPITPPCTAQGHTSLLTVEPGQTLDKTFQFIDQSEYLLLLHHSLIQYNMCLQAYHSYCTAQGHTGLLTVEPGQTFVKTFQFISH